MKCSLTPGRNLHNLKDTTFVMTHLVLVEGLHLWLWNGSRRISQTKSGCKRPADKTVYIDRPGVQNRPISPMMIRFWRFLGARVSRNFLFL